MQSFKWSEGEELFVDLRSIHHNRRLVMLSERRYSYEIGRIPEGEHLIASGLSSKGLRHAGEQVARAAYAAGHSRYADHNPTSSIILISAPQIIEPIAERLRNLLFAHFPRAHLKPIIEIFGRSKSGYCQVSVVLAGLPQQQFETFDWIGDSR